MAGRLICARDRIRVSMQGLVPARRRGYWERMSQRTKEAMFRFVTSKHSFFLAAGIAASAILGLTVALYVGKKYIAWRHSGDPLNGQAVLTTKVIGAGRCNDRTVRVRASHRGTVGSAWGRFGV
jgi:hypothetical protein